MNGGGLDPVQVASLLTASDPELKETASWIIGRHPEWAVALAGFFRDRLIKGKLTAVEQAELERQLARFATAPAIQSLLAERIADASAAAPVKLSSLKAMTQSGVKAVPSSWIEGLAKVLAGDDSELTTQAVATARALPLTRDNAGTLTPRLLAMAGRAHAPASFRLSALAAVPGGLSHVEPAVFSFLLGQLDREQPAAARTTAADILARARLTATQLDSLADALKTAGPLEADRLLTALEQSTDEALGLRLVKSLGASSALSSLRIDALKQHLAKFGAPVQSAAQELYARLNADIAKQKSRIDELATKVGQRRRAAGPARFPQREGRVLHMSRHRLSRGGHRPGLDEGRGGSHRARPPRGDRLSQCQLDPQLRTGRGRNRRRQGLQWPAAQRNLGRNLARDRGQSGSANLPG